MQAIIQGCTRLSNQMWPSKGQSAVVKVCRWCEEMGVDPTVSATLLVLKSDRTANSLHPINAART